MERYRQQPEENKPKLEIDFEQYGYKKDSQESQQLSGRLQSILKDGKDGVSKEIKRIYGNTRYWDAIKEKTNALLDVSKPKNEANLIRAGIIIDSANKLSRALYEEGTWQFITGPNLHLEGRTPINDIECANDQDLGNVHYKISDAIDALLEGGFT